MSKLLVAILAICFLTTAFAGDGAANTDPRQDSRISFSGSWWGPSHGQPAGGSPMPTGDTGNNDDDGGNDNGGDSGGDSGSDPSTGGSGDTGHTLPGVGKAKVPHQKSFLDKLLSFLDIGFFTCWP